MQSDHFHCIFMRSPNCILPTEASITLWFKRWAQMRFSSIFLFWFCYKIQLLEMREGEKELVRVKGASFVPRNDLKMHFYWRVDRVETAGNACCAHFCHRCAIWWETLPFSTSTLTIVYQALTLNKSFEMGEMLSPTMILTHTFLVSRDRQPRSRIK